MNDEERTPEGDDEAGVTRGDITRLLHQIGSGDAIAADELIPLVYSELRRLARSRMAHERGPQTLQPTALVHEAYLRLVGPEPAVFANRAHFFAAAAEAMRRILIERARRVGRIKRGAEGVHVPISDESIAAPSPAEEMLALDEVLQRLEVKDAEMARVVKLRYFAGMTVEETAEALQLAPRSVNRLWTAARAWLHRELQR